jgi:hypothetical protein
MTDEDGVARCPRCGSAALDHGHMGPARRFFRSAHWVQAGWDLKAFVCLDCGLLTQYLSDTYLDDLRTRNGLPRRNG